MSPRPDDVRLKQLQHEKTERIKRGIDKLERHSGTQTRAAVRECEQVFDHNLGST